MSVERQYGRRIRGTRPAANPTELLISSRPLPIYRRLVPPDGTRTPGTEPMIMVTRLNGPSFALNPDLIERADATPDTVLTLVDGTKYLIAESVDEVVEAIMDYRASIISRAQHIETKQPVERPLHVVPVKPEG
jgi:flagellar protein FlbD